MVDDKIPMNWPPPYLAYRCASTDGPICMWDYTYKCETPIPLFSAQVYFEMLCAERTYLQANGWVEDTPEEWSHMRHRRTGLGQKHAINVQRLFDDRHAQLRISERRRVV